MTPIRIQRRRTKGWKMPPNTVYVGRPSRWGNPYDASNKEALEVARSVVGGNLAEQLVWLYSAGLSYVLPDNIGEHVALLRGKNLACWCPLDQPCHADALLELANA